MKKKKRSKSPIVNLLMPEIKELIEEKNWQLLKDVIPQWQPPDIAKLLEDLEIQEALILFRLLPISLQSAVFSEFDIGKQKKILKSLNNKQVQAIIFELEPDDRTKLFEELAPNVVRSLINLLSTEERKETLSLLGYPKDSVGRLMTPEYVALKPQWTIKEAMKYIRKVGIDAETINMVYVVDDKWHLLDDIRLRRLILAEFNQTVESIMDHQFISINANADQEKAVELMKRYDLIALPVVDNEGYLLGIITVDDIMDIMEEEHTEDFTKFTGIESETVGVGFITKIKDVPLKKLYRSRVSWLFVLLIMDLITGGIIKSFQETIAKYVVLVTFLPVLVDTSGNAGSQTAILVIRAMALGTVKMKDWLYLLGREFLVASALGVTMGVGISFMGIIRGGSFLIAKIVVLSMIVNVIAGCLIGILLPFAFTKFKKDPATGSAPLITTLADIIGTGIYLGIAFLFLK
jgi:magnesium transporter